MLKEVLNNESCTVPMAFFVAFKNKTKNNKKSVKLINTKSSIKIFSYKWM